jgi:hypothetical protein
VRALEHPAPTADRADAPGPECPSEHDQDGVATTFALVGEPRPAGELGATDDPARDLYEHAEYGRLRAAEANEGGSP